MNSFILVGVDGSEPGHEALRWAARRSAEFGAALEIVAVLDDEWGAVGVDMLAELESGAHRLLEIEAEVARRVAPDTVVRARVVHGNPIYELAAASVEAALVVVGTHKTGYIRGRVFGSKSLQLAAAAACPVAVIPESSRRERSGIVVGIAPGAAGDAALTFAAAEARRTGEELVLLHGIEPAQQLSFELVGMPASGSADAGARVDSSLHDARIRVADMGYDVVVRSRELFGRPAEALVRAGESASLVVVGSSRRTGAERYSLGHVSHDVLLNITGPTIVIHALDD